jgi:hypothetical protein
VYASVASFLHQRLFFIAFIHEKRFAYGIIKEKQKDRKTASMFSGNLTVKRLLKKKINTNSIKNQYKINV